MAAKTAMTEVTLATLWARLAPKIGYLPEAERPLVRRALEFAYNAHAGQTRKSGEPYITHPVAVAEILAELRMDAETLAAGLLHDTVEDTAVTFEEIEATFGPSVRRIVEGETKVSKLPKMAEKLEDEQAENLRQMFIAMTEDVRIVIVKLADRLHNMRTLRFMPPEKQKRIAKETLEIFAPLAHRLGIGHIKTELEDLAFFYLYPAEYTSLKKRLEAHRALRQEVVDRARARLEAEIKKDPVLTRSLKGFTLSGRTKHLYSIWKKMQRDGRSLEQIYDLLALRVVLEPKDEATLGKQVCYHALGLVHQLWQPIPGRIKDYIATPKPNGYQSLHTTVIVEEGIPLEVQIRTAEMHRLAEYGIAAHWLYKEGLTDPREIERRVSWMRAIQEWQAEFSSSRDFVEAVTREILGGRVFVFTPKGKVINLPKGATVVDFAYHIHTEVGHRMTGAVVNGKIVPLSYELQNADIVRIITGSKTPSPSKDWLKYAKTRSARSKIRHFFRQKERAEELDKGKRMLERYLKKRGLPAPKESELEAAAQALKLHPSPEDLYLALAHGRVTPQQVAWVLHPTPQEPRAPRPKKAPEKALPIRLEGDLNVPVKLASCCRPVRGEPILGFITRGRGVTIHRADCPNMRRFLEKEPGRVVPAEWVEGRGEYPVALRLVASDRAGLLRDVMDVFAGMGKSVLGADTQANGQVARIQVRFTVKDDEELERIRARLLELPEVQTIARA